MKTIKKTLALVLALCMLVGLPMAVQANDTAEEELKLLYATRVPDIMANRSDSSTADRAIALYFNKCVTWGSNLYIRVVGYDKDGNVVQVQFPGTTKPEACDIGLNQNTKYAMTNPIVFNIPNANRNFDAMNSSALTPIDHFCVFIGDASDHSGSSATTKNDGKIAGITVDGTPITATHQMKTSRTGNDVYDALLVEVEEKEDVLVVNSVEILNDRQVHVGFSEAVTINMSHFSSKYHARFGVAKKAYQSAYQCYDYALQTGYQVAYKTMVTIDADGKGLTALFAEGVINEVLNSLYNYRKNDPNADYCLAFAFAEIESSNDAANGESSANSFVDAIRSKDTNKPLYVNAYGRYTAFCEIGSAVPLCVKPIDNYSVQLILSQEAQLRNGELITVDGQQATVTAVENTSNIDGVAVASAWTLTVENPLTDEVEVVLGEDAFYEVEASTISNKTEVDSSAAEIKLEDNAYNFMNADTGRVLAVGEIDELTPEKAGHNLYAFKIVDKYVDLTSGAPKLTDVKIVYGLRACDNDRYQIVIGNGVVADTDEGETNIASLALKVGTSTSIATGWYLTEKDGQRPLKVLPFGDSITFGVNDDVKNAGGLQIGWRDTVSQELLTYFNGRVVFVGPEKSIDTTLTDNILLRHAGYPSWVVDGSVYTTDKKGLASLSEDIKTKYVPDVTLLMIGTNDLSELNGGSGLTDEELADLMIRYERLVRSIAPKRGENGAVFASKLTPRQREDLNDNIVRFNEKLESTVKSLQDDDLAVYLNDNYTDFPTDAENQGWCDLEYAENRGLHLNDNGDAFVASRYVGVVKLYYGEDGVKKLAKITAQINGMPYASLAAAMNDATSGQTVTMLDNANMGAALMIPTGVTLDLNGNTLTVAQLAAFGNVVDSKNGEGKIAMEANTAEKNNLILQPSNTDLPLYDTEKGGYRFFTFTDLNPDCLIAENKSYVKFGVQLQFTNTEAYELLAAEANANAKFMVKLVVEKDGKSSALDYVINRSTLLSYAAAMKAPSNGTPTVVLTVQGLDGVTSLSGTFCYQSVAVMNYTGETHTASLAQ